ncbi:hypothetical protein HPP92_025645 [Vanilla planifolia]|uniref:Uncharacterized protein n=1 Tax=Vanilla planifolia TaxID=51239 RepID=A0A835UB86_VANPL|nr:hypothetical protein HPP92_025645 [Vanilla planifolia]
MATVAGLSLSWPFIMDEEDIKAIARLFASMGDSYVELIATVAKQIYHTIGSEESMQLLMPLLELLHTLTRRIFNDIQLWHHLQLHLTSRLVFRVEFCQNYDELSEEDYKDFTHIRYAVSEVLADATSFGREETLRVLFMMLVKAVELAVRIKITVGNSIEAALYCIRSLYPLISPQEVVILPSEVPPEQAKKALELLCLPTVTHYKFAILV